jgi:hypothetical protein
MMEAYLLENQYKNLLSMLTVITQQCFVQVPGKDLNVLYKSQART